jgi:two-component system nitrogen regulation response regulator GlnG
MINGESGTGKELVAQALHDYGKRKDGPFVAVNMAAIPKELIESELFGHEKGAFTGATSRSAGRFEQAEGGTLFLDEIGDMPLEAQTRLLRVLQEGEYTTVGGRHALNADVRIITATHQDLRQLIERKLFREDLFFRLNVALLRLPPLRQRSEDIPELVHHFLHQAVAGGYARKGIDEAALGVLKKQPWPGNVRQLKNVVQCLVALYPQALITADVVSAELRKNDAPPTLEPGDSDDRGGLAAAVERQLSRYFAAHRGELPAAGLYERVMREVEKPLITLSLQATRGNQVKAAEILGLNRNTLRKKIHDLNVSITRGGT